MYQMKNSTRRTIGILLCFSPVALLCAPIIAAFIGTQMSPFAAIGFVVPALLFAVLNSYLFFIRPWVWRRQRGTIDGIPNISGFPLIGTIMVILGGVFGFGAIGTALLGLIAVLLDPGGAPWFLVCT
jgi:hypothetical protein